ncbi:MAG: HEAT repeat domain-containing protein [Propionibacteriaceae bacterium]|nr:HEAT repeat domain-containing protein [Propionibacteriaceae bacterium]
MDCPEEVTLPQKSADGNVARLARAVRQARGTRLKAVQALGRSNDPRAIPTLAAASRDRDPAVRSAAIGALGQIVSGVLDPLRAAVGDDPSASEQISMVVLQPVVNALSDPDAGVRRAAAEAAGVLGERSLASRLVTCLGDPEPPVRATAAASLTQFGAPPPHQLITALAHADPSIRDGARDVVQAIGPEAAESLSWELRKAPHWDLRCAVATLLETLGWQPGADALGAAYWLSRGEWQRAADIGEAAVPALIEALSLDQDEPRELATHALAALGEKAVDPLLTMLAEPDADARQAAAEALLEMGSAAICALITALNDCTRVELGCLICELLGNIRDPRAVKPLLGCARSAEPELQRSAVAALGRIGDPAALPTLSDSLNSLAWGVPQTAAQAMGAIGDPSAIAPLVSALNSRSSWTRRAAAEALGVLGGAESVAGLVAALADPSPDVRRAAAAALGQAGADDQGTAEEVFRPLLTALSDEDPAVRAAAADALGALANPRALEPLISALTDRGPAVRQAVSDALETMSEVAVPPLIGALRAGHDDLRVRAAEVLGRIGDLRATDPLVEVARTPNERLRRAAVLALGELGDLSAAEALIACLGDKEDQVRAAAAEAIGWIGAGEAVPQLVAALADRSPGVRRAAATALIMACPGRR